MGKNRKQRVRNLQRGQGFFKRKPMAVLFACIFMTCMLAACQTDKALTLSYSVAGEESAAQATPQGDGDASSGDPLAQASSPLEEAGSKEGAGAQTEERIYVHVCGAVRDPGVKELPKGSRAFDALEQAGGFTEDADQAYVNLAGFLQDGQQLYFPAVGEALPRTEEAGSLVDLNTADEAMLCTLPGIGETRAKEILKYRKEHGGFSKVEELMEVPGIKEATYEKIRDLVMVRK
jgi:competence protein ComEA